MSALTASAEISLPGGSRRTAKVSVSRRSISPHHFVEVLELPARADLEDLVAITLRVTGDEVRALTSARELIRIPGRYEPPFPVGTFVVVRRDAAWWRVGVPWASRFEIEATRTGVTITARVQDRTACGLQTWGLDHFTRSTLPTTLQVTIDVLARPEECAWIEPYPGGARAVVCLTDHPDFDSSPKVSALAGLFARTGVKITKGVFPASQPSGHKQEPGLDHLDYLASIELLHGSGSEIAFHGFGPRVDAPALDDCKRRCDRMIPFTPRTWIDHGTGGYLFSRRATLQDGTSLRSFLRPYGIDSYWSYFDIWDNPVSELSCWLSRSSGDIPAEILRSFYELRHQKAALDPGKGTLYPLMHGLNNALGVHATNALRTRTPGLRLAQMVRASRRSVHEVRTTPFVVYGLDGAGYAVTRDQDWVFDTLLLNHPAMQLRGEALEQLAHRSGLLLAHVYLCAQHPYLRGGCFDPGSEANLDPAFVEAIEQLAAAQRAGSVITMTFAEVRATLTAYCSTNLERTAKGWQVHAPPAGPSLQVSMAATS